LTKKKQNITHVWQKLGGWCNLTMTTIYKHINGLTTSAMKNMKYLILISALFLLSTSFFPFKKKWIKTHKDYITLYSRPSGFSHSISPDSLKIQNILQEGIDCVEEIKKILEVNFSGEIKVYLYNFDEAEKEIGTNGGGGAIPTKGIILYTNFEKNNIDSTRNRIQYLGLHEYVHIVSFKSIGNATIRLFAEGYANAVDGTYGGKSIETYLSLKRMKTPSELLDSDNMFEGYFYPQSGFFIKWLFKEYSIKTVNKLFALPRENFEKEFEVITGESFQIMESKYLKYCENMLQK